MPNEVDIAELDATDLQDILTEINGKATKVKNVASARKELIALLEAKGLVLSTDDEGNFALNPKKAAKTTAKGKAAAKPEPEPEEDDEEEAEEEAEEDDEEEAEEPEEDEEEEAPPPKKSAKGKPAPAPAPKAKAKAKAPEPEEDEEDEEEAEEETKPSKSAKSKAPAKDGPKRPPPPREAKFGDDSAITIKEKDRKFKADSIRDHLWAVMRKSKTVGDFMKKAAAHERTDVQNTARGFLNVAVKDGWISVG